MPLHAVDLLPVIPRLQMPPPRRSERDNAHRLPPPVDGEVGELAGSTPGRPHAPFGHEDQPPGLKGEFLAAHHDRARARDAHEDDVHLVVDVLPHTPPGAEAHQVGV